MQDRLVSRDSTIASVAAGEGSPAPKPEAVENATQKLLRLRQEAKVAETTLENEIEATRAAWQEWVLTQTGGGQIGKFEGTFTGHDANGLPYERTVMVSIVSETDGRGFATGRKHLSSVFSIDTSNNGRNGVKVGRATEISTGKIGEFNTYGGEKSPIYVEPEINSTLSGESYRSVHRGMNGKLSFDSKSESHPEESPNFVDVARRELELISKGQGTLSAGYKLKQLPKS